MKKFRYFMSFVLCIVTLVSFSSINVDNAYCADNPVYIGEYCWLNGYGDLNRIGITLMGDGHFTYSGTLTSAGSEFGTTGNLEVVGNSVIGTVVGSRTYDNNTATYSYVGDFILDVSTLDGTYGTMVLRWEQGECFIEHDLSTLTSVSCGDSFSPDGVDNREELIRLLKMYSTTAEE